MPAGPELTKEEIETRLKKGGENYAAELKKKSVKSREEWMGLIDSLKPGMLDDQVVAVLPLASFGTSNLWSYNGMNLSKLRQTHFWALDSGYAVAVVMDFGGDDAWIKGRQARTSTAPASE